MWEFSAKDIKGFVLRRDPSYQPAYRKTQIHSCGITQLQQNSTQMALRGNMDVSSERIAQVFEMAMGPLLPGAW